MKISDIQPESARDQIAVAAALIPDGECVPMAEFLKQFNVNANTVGRHARDLGISIAGYFGEGARKRTYIANKKTVAEWLAKTSKT